MSEMRGLEQLQVWRKAIDLAVLVCREVLPGFPSQEQYALTSQLRRAVQSIHANIAEAHGRYHYTDAIRFLYIARGSLEEVLSHLILAYELEYLADELYEMVYEMVKNTSRMLNGYIRYQSQRRSRDEGQIRELAIVYEASQDGVTWNIDLIPDPEYLTTIFYSRDHSPLDKELS